MGLELTIQDDTGYPKEYVSIEMGHYEDIMHFARCFHGYPLVRRMHDYFEKAYYEADEIQPLLHELDQFKAELNERTNLSPNDPLFATVDKLRELCEQAISQNRHLIALPD